MGTACADLIMAWLQQQPSRERPDTFTQLESSFCDVAAPRTDEAAIHFLREARGVRCIQHLFGEQRLQPRVLVLGAFGRFASDTTMPPARYCPQ